MSEQKHFSYESEEPVVVKPDSGPVEIEIKDVLFMTPAKVVLNEGIEEILSIDLVNRKAYKGDAVVSYSDKVFEYLDRVNTLPEDFFEASEDIYEKANEAAEELEEIRKRTQEEVN